MSLHYQLADPTPRTDRIEADYQTEYPDIKVEPRKLVKKHSTETKEKQKNLAEVKLDDEVRIREIQRNFCNIAFGVGILLQDVISECDLRSISSSDTSYSMNIVSYLYNGYISLSYSRTQFLQEYKNVDWVILRRCSQKVIRLLPLGRNIQGNFLFVTREQIRMMSGRPLLTSQRQRKQIKCWLCLKIAALLSKCTRESALALLN